MVLEILRRGGELKPYIGVAGFMNRGEAEEVLAVFPKDSSRQLMVGVLASEQTLGGQPNERPNRFPGRMMVEHVFPDSPLALNIVHYNTSSPATLTSQMGAFAELFGGPNFHGFQLNLAWPPPGKLANYRRTCEGVIVLKIGGHAFGVAEHSPKKVAEKVAEYRGLVEYLLLDSSCGRGQPLDTEQARAYLRELREKDLGIGLGVAGGLSAETLYLVEPLVEEFPDLSIDAEGRLRGENDHLDVEAAKRYVSAALEMFF